MSDQERWAWLREQTPVLRDYVYLNCGWSGPLSYPVVEAMRRRLDLELWHGPTTRTVMDDRQATTARLREASARMLGADADEIAITGNTTEGVNIAVNGLDLRAGDGIVTTTAEHGGGIVPAYFLRERRGCELRLVPLEAECSPGEVLERFDQAIDANTRLVLLSEITYSTGQLLPLAEISRLAHARGASVVVDGAQTAGHVPIDVHALGVDAYAVPSHKWLCGPDGLGMLYVRRERIAGFDPVKVSGRAAASYDFEGGFEPEREKVTKFEVSTTSGPVVAGTLAAVEQYLESGPVAVWDRVRDLNRAAEARFANIPGVAPASPCIDTTRSGLFLVTVGEEDPGRVAAYLQRDHRVVARAVRQYNAVRLSLHAYNTEADIERAATGIEQALSEGIPDDILAPVPGGAE